MNILNLHEKNCILNYLKKNLREVAESFYIFLRIPDKLKTCVEIMQSIFSDNYIHRYNIEILILFDPELQLISTKTMI